MLAASALSLSPADDIDVYLARHQEKSLLRFITCGSVDDGKSTLIGRLLYDSKMIFEDQMAALEADSKKLNSQSGAIDFALLVDGLAAEREQGITIDVAYRFFATDKRKFIVADTPGHEQYTRNMATGASTADLAVILADARKGVLTQTRRHSFLASLLGIRRVALAVNKMDLVEFSQERFEEIVAAYRAFAQDLGFDEIFAVPISGLLGDNITQNSANTPWFTGPTLLQFLENAPVDEARAQRAPFRMPVQWVNRPHLDFRGFSGLIASGRVRPGDEIVVAPSGRRSRVARIVTADGDLAEAVAGQAVTLTLTDEIDASRGDILAAASAPLRSAARLDCDLIWMADAPLLPGRSYWLKIGAQTVPAQVLEPRHRVDVNTMQRLAATQLGLNEIGECPLRLDRAIAFETYADNRELGGFVLIDRMTNSTVAAGLIRGASDGSDGSDWRTLAVTPQARAALMGQKPALLWFTGENVEAVREVAAMTERRLHALGRRTGLFDAAALSMSAAEAARAARLMLEAGLVVLGIAPTGKAGASPALVGAERFDIWVGPAGRQDGEQIQIDPGRVSPAEAAEFIAARITGEGDPGDWAV